ncbi:MAG: ATPase P [Deltaproteobacteria bacterium]|nr:ATPase P [Deltaproteobacteria bacterium]
MIEISIPDFGNIRIRHLVLDYNGTLACDGKLLDGVKEELVRLSESLEIHVLTADTFGKAKAGLDGIPCKLTILPKEAQDKGKLDFIMQLGASETACIGNGRNDRLMLANSALGIAVILEEGAASVTLASADVVCKDIVTALKLFSNPLRLIATLRS